MTTTPQAQAAFEPLLSQREPGGSLILDKNLLAIRGAFGNFAASVNSALRAIVIDGGGVPLTRRIDTTAPLVGGGALSSDLTLSLATDGSLVVGGGLLSRAALTGDVTAAAGSNATTIATHAVTYAKVQQASTHTLIGNPTGGTADVQEITLGTNLSFAGNVLNATGGGSVSLPANEIGYGTGAGITSSASLTYDSAANQLLLGATAAPAFSANLDILTASGPGGLTTHTTSASASDFTGFIAYLGASLTAAPYIQFFVPTLANTTFGPAGSAIFDANTSGVGQLRFGNSSAGNGIEFYTGLARTTVMSLSSGGVLTVNGLGSAMTKTVAGALTPAVSGVDYQGAITWPAATDVLVSSGTGTVPVGDANFTYDTTAHTMTLLGSAPIALGTGTQTITKASGTLAFTTTGAGAFTFSPNSTLTLSLTTAGQVRVNSLTAGGMVSASVGSGQLGIAVAGTDYQAPVVWPTASQVLISAGVAVDPLGDSTFTFDRVAHVMAGGDAIGINGVAVPTNAHLVTGSSNNTNRDRIQFFVGGGALGSTGTGDNTLLDVNPIATTIRVGVTAGIYATQRIRGITYAGGGTSITEAATLYIDDAPTLGGGISSPSPYALHVAAGQTKLGGTLFLPLLVAGGALAVDTTGLVGLAGVGGMTPAICGEQHYYINATGASLATGANNWLVTSQITGVGNVRTDNVHAFAAAKASLSIRLLNNSMATGSLAVQIMRNGGTFATISILPASVAPSTISIVPTTVGSPAAADTWGVLVNGTATFGAGNMIFTVDLMLSPNVF